MPVVRSVEELVGDTPLYHLPLKHSPCMLYLKLEYFNAGHSVKARIALNMLFEAEKEGRLRPGDTIIESSSGNTGIALAMLAAARGYKFICVVDNHVQEEKIRILEAYGAIIERVGRNLPADYHAAKERIARVEELRAEHPQAYFVDQGDNPNNAEAHYKTTGPEILRDLGNVDYLFASVGTGGSISGTGRRLREQNLKVRIVGIEPAGSIIFGKPYHPFFQSGSGSAKLIFKNVDFGMIDENFSVNDNRAFTSCLYMAQRKGLMFGGSGGSVVFGAIDYLIRNTCRGVAVAIIPDGGERYLSSVYNRQWMEQHKFLDQETWDYLDENM